ncbi:hypothetical protein SGGMMB4_02637 [Sodalis glossinidius str. 'morsitans']|uniref:Bro-N domain-containing protein n=1 Tax=Sodalis glossinidius (strain morsitans) TaxID=343509 RepID=A0A193QIU1_SODGM|nr:hypothetical protein SGGMMB4_02637 [Sodalis glossinidius str. 'morsitans']
MTTTLTFRNTILETVAHDGQIWFTSVVLAKALDYRQLDSIKNIYNWNKDEFTSCMTTAVNLTVNRINNSLREKAVRVFSLRGAHLT